MNSGPSLAIRIAAEMDLLRPFHKLPHTSSGSTQDSVAVYPKTMSVDARPPFGIQLETGNACFQYHHKVMRSAIESAPSDLTLKVVCVGGTHPAGPGWYQPLVAAGFRGFLQFHLRLMASKPATAPGQASATPEPTAGV